jgi:hypothetical protein
MIVMAMIVSFFCDNGKGKVKGLALVKLANKLETPILRKHNKH